MSVRGLGMDCWVDEALRSVWFRCATFPRNIGTSRLWKEDVAAAQWQAFIRGLMVFDHAAWMNHPMHTYMAETKPYQLLAAARVGFKVPTSLVSNDVAAIQREFKDVFAAKSIDTVYVKDGDNAIFAYTQFVNSCDLTDQNVSSMPLMAQVALQPKTDLRITVVGARAFGYKIFVDGRPAEGDWRLNRRASITYEPVELDDGTANRCTTFCQHLGIPFGAIDLAICNDEVWFIEINPTGEWAWLPNAPETAGNSIADWLGSVS